METAPVSELLRAYAATGCNDAFVELMRRYVDLVYGAALRRLDGDAGLAEDVVQRVFLELAGHARKLRVESSLGGWLYTRATRIAADMHRSDQRRRAREMTAARLSGGAEPSADDWQGGPELEDAIGRLPAVDRNALVMRFIEDRPLRSVGAALGVSEDAAQKRISRALHKLRRQLTRRGVACTAAGLTLALTRRSAEAVPGEIFRHLAAHAPAATVAAGKNGAAALLQIFAMKPVAIASLAVAAAIGVAIPFLLPHAGDDPGAKLAGDAAGKVRPPARPEDRRGPAENETPPSASVPAGRAGIPLLPGLTAEQREAALKQARAQAEKATLDRFEEKMARLKKKLKLTAAQESRVREWHLAQRNKWVEYLTGAAVAEAEPQYYYLEVSCRPDIPAALTGDFSDEQRRLLADHETNRRSNYLEAVTGGELGQLALKLDLTESSKEALFQRLSAINSTDLFEDYTGIADLDGVAAQADRDLERRRVAFAEVLDAEQMRIWEGVATGYRSSLLKKFGYREPQAASANAAKPPGSAG